MAPAPSQSSRAGRSEPSGHLSPAAITATTPPCFAAARATADAFRRQPAYVGFPSTMRLSFPPLLLLLLIPAPLTAQEPTPPTPGEAEPIPSFPARIEQVTVDVVVTDKQTRDPVTGLSAGEFRIEEDGVHLELLEPYRPGLKQLDRFGHVIVFWWADRCDDGESRSRLQCRPPYASDYLTGVFATRAEYRPNPIAMTTCKVLAVDQEAGIVQVANMAGELFRAFACLEGKRSIQALNRRASESKRSTWKMDDLTKPVRRHRQ